MRLTRREFTATTAAGVAGMAFGLPALAQTDRRARRDWLFDWEEVASGLHVAIGQGGNAMVIRHADGATLIDCKNAGFGDALKREGERKTKGLVRVINTHHHADHSGGNYAFTDGDTPLIAHENAKPRIAGQVDSYKQSLRSALNELGRARTRLYRKVREDIRTRLEERDAWDGETFAPTKTMTDELDIKADGLTMQLRYVGNAHTDNDVFIRIPERNVLHTGDLLFNGKHPFIDVGAGATTRGWDKAIDAMLELIDDDTTVVPGHGPVTDKAGLKKQRAYFATLRDIVTKAKKRGKSRDEITGLSDPRIDGLDFERMKPQNLGIVYDELEQE